MVGIVGPGKVYLDGTMRGIWHNYFVLVAGAIHGYLNVVGFSYWSIECIVRGNQGRRVVFLR